MYGQMVLSETGKITFCRGQGESAHPHVLRIEDRDDVLEVALDDYALLMLAILANGEVVRLKAKQEAAMAAAGPVETTYPTRQE